jgi:hypothetical protein
MYSIKLLLSILFVFSGITAHATAPDELSNFEGKYERDDETSSRSCSEARAYTIEMSKTGSQVSVTNYEGAQYGWIGGYQLENKSSSWDDIYDLHLFFQKSQTTLRGLRGWKIDTMISLFGLERVTKKFMFVKGGPNQFIIVSRRTYAKMAEGIQLNPLSTICTYKKIDGR